MLAFKRQGKGKKQNGKNISPYLKLPHLDLLKHLFWRRCSLLNDLVSKWPDRFYCKLTGCQRSSCKGWFLESV